MNPKISPLVLMFSILVLASLACQAVTRAVGADPGDAPTSQPVKTPQTGKQPTVQPAVGGSQELRQWAASATASSSYGNPDWNAEQALGVPDVPECSDNKLAWASHLADGKDWIELTYTIPVIPTEINIYQSYNPSQVVKVELIGKDGTVEVAWEGSPEQNATCPYVMTITFDQTEKLLVEKVIVHVDQSALGLGWNEIDAVELVGLKGGN